MAKRPLALVQFSIPVKVDWSAMPVTLYTQGMHGSPQAFVDEDADKLYLGDLVFPLSGREVGHYKFAKAAKGTVKTEE